MKLFRLSLKQKKTPPPNSEQGLTLLEVMASMVMISVILVAMAPPLLLSAATRVKMRRASQAQLIAQEEVNRVQGVMARSRDEKLPTDPADCDPTESDCTYVGLPETILDDDTLEAFAAPDSSSEVEKIDVDDDGNPDFFVQTFREEGAVFTAGNRTCEPAIFRMGVRVYSIVAEDNLEETEEGNLETEPISLQMTSGLQGQTTQPMAVLFTEISRSDMERSLGAYQDYINEESIPAECNTDEES